MGRSWISVAGLPFLSLLAVAILSLFIPFTNGSENILNAGPITDAPMYPTDPDVWVEVENSEYEMIVEPGRAETTPIRAWVHCETPPGFPPGEQIIVYVNIGGLSYQSNVYEFAFDKRNDVVEMNIEVNPQIGVSVDRGILIQFIPSWYIQSGQRSGGGTMDEAMVHPIPYGSLYVRDMGSQRFNVGETHYVEIEVENNGNCMAQVSMNFEAVEGIEYILPETILSIPERSFGVYRLGMRQSSGSGKEGLIHINAVSSVPGLFSTYGIDMEFTTLGKVEVFFTNPIVNVFLLILMVLLIVSIVIFVRKRQKKRELRLN